MIALANSLERGRAVNNSLKMTTHAKKRSAQRAIPELCVNLLMQYGELTEQKGGTSVVELSKQTEKWLRQQLIETLAHWDQRHAVYAVLGEGGTVVTTGHRFAVHETHRRRTKLPRRPARFTGSF